MHRFSHLLLYIGLSLGFSACYVPPPDQDLPQGGPFFDLQAFFEQEAKALTASAPRLKKTIQHNGTSETHMVQVDDWMAELRFFSNADINKPSWRDQYQVDTLVHTGGYKLQYRALDEKLSTQLLEITLQADTVVAVVARKLIDNQIYRSQQHLTYLPKQYYTIEQQQDVALISPTDYTIQAEYQYE